MLASTVALFINNPDSMQETMKLDGPVDVDARNVPFSSSRTEA